MRVRVHMHAWEVVWRCVGVGAVVWLILVVRVGACVVVFEFECTSKSVVLSSRKWCSMAEGWVDMARACSRRGHVIYVSRRGRSLCPEGASWGR